MFFSNKDAGYSADAPNKNKFESEYPKLKQFYFKDFDGQKLVLNLSNQLKSSFAIIAFEDGSAYPASYIGQVLFYLNSVIMLIGENVALSPSMQKWLEGDLPVNVNPQIEIGPDKIVGYALETVQKYPAGLLKSHEAQLEAFVQEYRKTEILDKMRKL
jgi:hypothetical protein